MMNLKLWILVVLLSLSSPIFAQTDEDLITIDNFTQLSSQYTIDFADISTFNSGWFALSDNGEWMAVVDIEHQVWRLSASDSQVLYTQPDFVTGVFFENTFIGVHTLENGILVVIADGESIDQIVLPSESDSIDYPAEVWADEVTIALELQPTNPDLRPRVALIDRTTQEVTIEPYAPAQSTDAVVRVGRIPAPYALTSTFVGEVTLWNWVTGESLYTLNNNTEQPSVFGNINASTTQFVWRDNANETLYLLNFMDGTNEIIDALNGDYAQWYFLSTNADVIFAVNLGFLPNVVAWNVQNRERIELGNYRTCERPQPDMARLSTDGTTLVIGCDTGLDIWRINPVVP
jgi:hypothetical protein